MSGAHFLLARDVAARMEIAASLELVSPCHLGGGPEESTTDQPLVRDATGRPILPGTTLKGVLRAILEEADEAQAAGELFGGDLDAARESSPVAPASNRKVPALPQARLLVDDAPVEQAGVVPSEVRDGVAIDAELGIAADFQKYDFEVLPPGTRFRLSLELLLPESAAARARLCRGMCLLLERLETAGVLLGARTRRGFGHARVVPRGSFTWRVREYNTRTLDSPDGLLAWLGQGVSGLAANWPATPTVEYSSVLPLATHWGMAESNLACRPRRETLRIHLHLLVDGGMIVRSGGHDATAADAEHLRRLELRTTDSTGGSRRVPVIPGTTLAGGLRHRCRRIVRTLEQSPDWEASRGRALIEGMFGPESIRHDRGPWASRLLAPEVVIEGGVDHYLRHTRVRIDRWTGGALEGYLLTEDVVFGGRLEFEVVLETARRDGVPEDAATCVQRVGAERALLLLALRDLATGELPLGGESGIGRGRLAPGGAGGKFAEIRDWPEPGRTVTLTLGSDGAVLTDPADAFSDDFQRLRRQLGKPEDQPR